ncbi:hypothetical protein [Clostridium folliculivorans]|uniref:Uncharacterized protein n=1 Tax=Clostridium folliculivorans TaxID=2886038 RepID=A0A9W6DBP9_9CLOT|nr:hypothetical protein [Clostridium folliculivorans]GKU26670.1 hypothetical protein CFOLD11_34970 [Clostridium folliculivorans]GKU28898.1 hypothetical protein CFB3_10040 [Clostridium folliculivorans]
MKINDEDHKNTNKTIDRKRFLKIIPLPICIAIGIIVGVYTHNFTLCFSISVAIGAGLMVSNMSRE